MELTHRGAELPKTPEVMKLVRKELVVAPLSPQNPFPTTFKVFAETPTKVIVPQFWARKAFLAAEFTDGRPPAAPFAEPHNFMGTLKPELRQLEAVAAVQAAWSHTGGAMLCLPPGFGKTTCALYLAAQLGLKTLVVVHKEFLAQQWTERIQQFVPAATITRVQGDTCDTSGDFVIAMLQTLVSRQYPAAAFKGIGLVCADEVHHIAAKAFSQAMFALAAPYMLGLSATPDRRDGLGRVVTWFMGDVAFRVRRENQLATEVRTVKYTCPRYQQPPPVNKMGNMCYTSIVTILAADKQRTEIIAREAAALARAGRDVLVLSHRRGHCTDICSALSLKGVDCATYLGGDKAVPDTQVIVATYALTSEGFDCPRLTALVLATPASDVEQSVGRVMRGSAEANAIIVDLVDEWGVCYAQAAKRRRLYKTSGFLSGDASDKPVAATFDFLD